MTTHAVLVLKDRSDYQSDAFLAGKVPDMFLASDRHQQEFRVVDNVVVGVPESIPSWKVELEAVIAKMMSLL